MADTKYTILGMTGSGKTCFITAMYSEMAVGAGMDGFTLTTDDKTRMKLETDIQRLRQLSGGERFPQPTQTNVESIRRYEFSLNYAQRKIITCELLDYAGGVLGGSQGGGPVFQEVVKSIAESTALLIMVDGKLLCGRNPEERADAVRFDCALTILPIIAKYTDAHPNDPLPPIIFVITKSDLCGQFVRQEEVTSLIKAFFPPAFGEGTRSYICAVSLGETIGDNAYSGRFHPINVHLPFFIGAYHDFYSRCSLRYQHLRERGHDLLFEKDHTAYEYAREKSRWIFKRKDYMRKLKEEMDAQQKEWRDIFNEFGTLRDLYDRFSARLEQDRSNFKCFANGVEEREFRRFRL